MSARAVAQTNQRRDTVEVDDVDLQTWNSYVPYLYNVVLYAKAVRQPPNPSIAVLAPVSLASEKERLCLSPVSAPQPPRANRSPCLVPQPNSILQLLHIVGIG